MPDLFLLDVVDVVPARSNGPDASFYLVVAGTILAEAGMMWWMRYNAFLRSLLHSFIANAVSLAAGFLLIDLLPKIFNSYGLSNLFVLMLITIAIELPVLYLLNRSKVFKQTLLAVIFMNVISYLLFFLYIRLIAS